MNGRGRISTGLFVTKLEYFQIHRQCSNKQVYETHQIKTPKSAIMAKNKGNYRNELPLDGVMCMTRKDELPTVHLVWRFIRFR